MQLIRTLLALAAMFTALTVSLSAAAVTQPMAGQWRIQNPSLIFFPQYLDEIGPRLRTGLTVMGTGATDDPAVAGNPIVLPANAFSGAGTLKRAFPPFPSVAQLSFTYTETHSPAIFAAGAGAAATGNIQFCPPLANVPPAPTGGTNCTLFSPVPVGVQPVRIQITAGTQGPAFGGAMRMLRQNTGVVWFAPVVQTGIMSKQPNPVTGKPWSPGITNYAFVVDTNPPGILQSGMKSALGKVSTLMGPTIPNTAATTFGSGWGFKFTTGTIGGSDSFPPVGVCPPVTGTLGCFFWTDMGYESITPVSSARNIVLVAGAVARGGASGNLFHRSATLRMVIPEPSTALGAAAGLAALAGLARARRHG
jgi:hypothetical protein